MLDKLVTWEKCIFLAVQAEAGDAVGAQFAFLVLVVGLSGCPDSSYAY